MQNNECMIYLNTINICVFNSYICVLNSQISTNEKQYYNIKFVKLIYLIRPQQINLLGTLRSLTPYVPKVKPLKRFKINFIFAYLMIQTQW